MQKHWPLILGVGVPALFLLTVLGVALLPKLGEGPAHNVLFTGDDRDYYYGNNDYVDTVEDGKLVRRVNEEALKEWNYSGGNNYQTRREPDPTRAKKLYVYNFEDESLKEISLEEAQKLSLDAGPTSEDGFWVGNPGYGDYGLFELFGSGRSRAGKLPIYKDDKVVDEITLPRTSNYYYGGLSFLAWIK